MFLQASNILQSLMTGFEPSCLRFFVLFLVFSSWKKPWIPQLIYWIATNLTVGVRFPIETKIFLNTSISNTSGAYPNFCIMGVRTTYLRLKRTELEPTHFLLVPSLRKPWLSIPPLFHKSSCLGVCLSSGKIHFYSNIYIYCDVYGGTRHVNDGF
jgi:hypothetical protein